MAACGGFRSVLSFSHHTMVSLAGLQIGRFFFLVIVDFSVRTAFLACYSVSNCCDTPPKEVPLIYSVPC